MRSGHEAAMVGLIGDAGCNTVMLQGWDGGGGFKNSMVIFV